MSIVRVKQAAEFLEVTPDTVRKWCNAGKLPFHKNVSGQRIFDMNELTDYRNKKLGIEEKRPKAPQKMAFYVRSSDNNDVTIETQISILTKEFGNPDRIFRDKASGLNEKRKGFNSLLDSIEKKEFSIVAATNKDRITRFGFSYVERICKTNSVELKIANSDETKDPHEILIQDFMSLLASFSGKFYRLRGWENQKKFLSDIGNEVKKREKK